MELIRPGFRVDFIGYRKYAYILSGILIAISLASLFFIRGLNYGIDFAGGLELQVAFKDSVETGDVRNAMRTVGLEQAAIQSVSGGEANEFLIRMHQIEEDPTKSISTVAENANSLVYVFVRLPSKTSSSAALEKQCSRPMRTISESGEPAVYRLRTCCMIDGGLSGVMGPVSSRSSRRAISDLAHSIDCTLPRDAGRSTVVFTADYCHVTVKWMASPSIRDAR